MSIILGMYTVVTLCLAGVFFVLAYRSRKNLYVAPQIVQNHADDGHKLLRPMTMIMPPAAVEQSAYQYRKLGFENVYSLRRYAIAKGLPTEPVEAYIPNEHVPASVIQAAQWQKSHL